MTLTEVMVGVLVGVMVLIALFMLMRTGTRAFGKARARLTNLQAATVLIEWLDRDLRMLYESPTRQIDLDKYKVSFYVFDPDASRLSRDHRYPEIRLKKITYRFDSDKSSVHRREDDDPWMQFRGTFESVAFFFIPPNFDKSIGPLAFNNYFNVRITCATGQELKINRKLPSFQDPRRKTINVMTLITSYGADMKARRNLYPVWNAPLLPKTL